MPVGQTGAAVSFGRQTTFGAAQYTNYALNSPYTVTSGVDPARPGNIDPWGNYQSAFAAAKWELEASPEEIYDIELEHSLLEANAKIAGENRAVLDNHGITAIDFMGAIGSGKTTLIARLVEKLKDKHGVAVFNGDLKFVRAPLT